MFFAQALLFNRAGADGLQLGFAADDWKGKPWVMEDLSDPDKVTCADKQYMVDPIELRPGTFELTRDGFLEPQVVTHETGKS